MAPDAVSPDVFVSSTPESLALHASRWLVEQIRNHQDSSTRPFTLSLAGGATPKRLYQLLAQEEFANRIDWQRVLLLWGDERNVAADDADSNYRMVNECWLSRSEIPSRNIVAVPDPGGDAQRAADGYEQTLRSRLSINSSGWPQIDCVLLGLGDDVHTASLFPGTPGLDERQRWVIAHHVPKLDSWRISMTAPLINSARRVAFLISGASKTQALKILWHGPVDGRLYPAQLIHPKHGKLSYFVDQDALGDLATPQDWTIVRQSDQSDQTIIQIFACGGTIDKIYFDAKSDYQVGEPQVRTILEQVRAVTGYSIRSLLRKDSLDITNDDRQQIRLAVQECDANRILITHGTDQMPETARALKGIAGKTIVMTGATTPASFVDSDAQFNIGCALGALMCLPEGVYIVMNGRIYPGDRVKKNRQLSRFDPID